MLLPLYQPQKGTRNGRGVDLDALNTLTNLAGVCEYN